MYFHTQNEVKEAARKACERMAGLGIEVPYQTMLEGMSHAAFGTTWNVTCGKVPKGEKAPAERTDYVVESFNDQGIVIERRQADTDLQADWAFGTVGRFLMPGETVVLLDYNLNEIARLQCTESATRQMFMRNQASGIYDGTMEYQKKIALAYKQGGASCAQMLANAARGYLPPDIAEEVDEWINMTLIQWRDERPTGDRPETPALDILYSEKNPPTFAEFEP